MDFNELYPETCTSVSAAARLGDYQRLKILLDEGRPSNIQDNRGWRALHHAASNGHLECVKLLLKAVDVEVNAQSFESKTALHLVCSSRLDPIIIVNVASALLEGGADTTSQNKDQFSSLFNEAILIESIELIQLLLNYKVDVNAVDYQYGSALNIAASLGSADIVDLLFKQRIILNPRVTNSCLFFHQLVSRKPCDIELLKKFLRKPVCLVHINHQCEEGNTALLVACFTGEKEAIDLLLDYGANSNIRNNNGILPLNAFVKWIQDNESINEESLFARLYRETYKWEIKKIKEEVNRDVHRESSFFHSVCFLEKRNILSYTLDKDASITPNSVLMPLDLTTVSYNVCLMSPLAFYCGFSRKIDFSMIQLLLRDVTDINDCSNGRVPPLLMPVVTRYLRYDEVNRTPIVHHLMELGADVLIKYPMINSGLSFASLPLVFLFAMSCDDVTYLEFLIRQCVPADVVFHHQFFRSLMDDFEIFGDLFSSKTPYEGTFLLKKFLNVLNLLNLYLTRVPSYAFKLLSSIESRCADEAETVQNELENFVKICESPKSLFHLTSLEVRLRLWNANVGRPLSASIEKLLKELNLPNFINETLLGKFEI